jgi:hypothetical protein
MIVTVVIKLEAIALNRLLLMIDLPVANLQWIK